MLTSICNIAAALPEGFAGLPAAVAALAGVPGQLAAMQAQLDQLLVQQAQFSARLSNSTVTEGADALEKVRNDAGEPLPAVYPATVQAFRDLQGPAVTQLLRYFGIAAVPRSVAERKRRLARLIGLPFPVARV